MNRFEDELKWALSKREPPSGFTDRVMARIPNVPAEPRQKWYTRFFRVLDGGLASRRWSPALAAALIAVVVGGTWEYRENERRREGERTKQELMVALGVASNALDHTRQKLLDTIGRKQ